jgi:predicted nuclease of predicted toxin-antitoxin system
MRIKLDENLPARLAAVLTKLHHDVHTVAEENLSGKSDREIWEAAQQEERFLIKQNLDFSDLRRFTPGTHCGILLVRLRSPDRQSLIQRVREIFQREAASQWAACFVVATDRKLRIVRPPGEKGAV